MQRFWLQAVIIIGAGLFTGIGFALTSNLPRDVKLKDNSGVVMIPPDHAKPPVDSDADLISVAAAKALFDSRNAVFIDSRPRAEYLQSHIVGAMQLEKGDLDGPPPAKVLNYLPGMEVVVYCHGELCTDSANVVKRLLALNKGIGPMHIIKDGFPGWQKAGHPVESGPEAGFQ